MVPVGHCSWVPSPLVKQLQLLPSGYQAVVSVATVIWYTWRNMTGPSSTFEGWYVDLGESRPGEKFMKKNLFFCKTMSRIQFIKELIPWEGENLSDLLTRRTHPHNDSMPGSGCTFQKEKKPKTAFREEALHMCYSNKSKEENMVVPSRLTRLFSYELLWISPGWIIQWFG